MANEEKQIAFTDYSLTVNVDPKEKEAIEEFKRRGFRPAKSGDNAPVEQQSK